MVEVGSEWLVVGPDDLLSSVGADDIYLKQTTLEFVLNGILVVAKFIHDELPGFH